MSTNERPTGAVLASYPHATYSGEVGIAIQDLTTKDLRLAWKGVETHTLHGLTQKVFDMLDPDNGVRLKIQFHGFDDDTHILLYSFGKDGSPLGCSKKGSYLKFGGEIRIDRRPGTHGVPQVDHAIPQRSIPSYKVGPDLFAVEIPQDYLKRKPLVSSVEEKKVLVNLDKWVSAHPGVCLKRSDLAHLIKEDDLKASFSRATSQIKAFIRANPDDLYFIDRGRNKHSLVATPPSNKEE